MASGRPLPDGDLAVLADRDHERVRVGQRRAGRPGALAGLGALAVEVLLHYAPSCSTTWSTQAV